MQPFHEKIPHCTMKYLVSSGHEMANERSHTSVVEMKVHAYHPVLHVTLKIKDVVVELPNVDYIDVRGCRCCAHHGGGFIDQLLDVLGSLGNDNAGCKQTD